MDSKKNKWLIIFPDPWINYSPSIINFIKMLEKNDHHYIVFYFEDGTFDNASFGASFNSISVKLKKNFFTRLLKKIKLLTLVKTLFFFLKIIKEVNLVDYQKIVGVDSLGYIIGRFLSKKVIYYSLEVSKSQLNKFIFNKIPPDWLVIQSVPRLNYLAHTFHKTVFIQNSPILQEISYKKNTYSGKLLYLGNIIKEHGVEICIESLNYLKGETLYIKGIGDYKYINYLKEKYGELYANGRFIIDNEYVEQSDLKNFMKDFDIGFCLYDFNKIGDDFNYKSSPSGKMFNYFMASIPVIGNNIIGLNIVKEYGAGFLLDRTDVESIVDAVAKIKNDYSLLSSNAYAVACIYDFEKMFMLSWDNLRK